jgi:transposase
LERLAEALLKYETLNREEVQKIMRGESIGRSTVSELLDAERQKGEQKQSEQGREVQPETSTLGGDSSEGPMPSPA